VPKLLPQIDEQLNINLGYRHNVQFVTT